MKKIRHIITAFTLVLLAAAVIPYALPFTDNSVFIGNYRIPYSMGDDYYLYSRYSGHVESGNTIPVIGDSVIWGHYTGRDQTLTAHLNVISKDKKTRFSNLGLDGIHPAAMSGLIDHYMAGFKNRKIIAGVNLLWMSSPRHDLSGPANSEINHKQLLPQVTRAIPSYQPAFEERISALVTRSVPVFSWIDHIRMSRFAGKNFYAWTMENPHKSILEYFSHKDEEYRLPEGTDPGRMQEQNIEWIPPDRSLQWKFMVKALVSLKNDGNEVAAVITPFNTYMMTEESRKKYFSILSEMEWILRENGILPVVPLILEKKYFADSSHPTSEGYRLIAEDIMKNREFSEFIGR